MKHYMYMETNDIKVLLGSSHVPYPLEHVMKLSTLQVSNSTCLLD